MKESAFRTAVLGKLPKHVHRQPMVASFHSFPGTPDSYLDYIHDLWAEFKVLRLDDHLPAHLPKESLPTAEQDRWLTRRWERGRNAVVVIGVKLKSRSHGLILHHPAQWRGPVSRAIYEPLLVPARDLALQLTLRVS